MPVAAEYDREADALYIRWSDAETAHTVELDDCRVLDFDASGSVIGMEVLYPAQNQNLAISPIARQHGFGGLLDEIDTAVAEAMSPAPAYTASFAVFYALPVGITGPSPTGSRGGKSGSEAQPFELTLAS